jgi:hypothetical protein
MKNSLLYDLAGSFSYDPCINSIVYCSIILFFDIGLGSSNYSTIILIGLLFKLHAVGWDQLFASQV